MNNQLGRPQNWPLLEAQPTVHADRTANAFANKRDTKRPREPPQERTRETQRCCSQALFTTGCHGLILGGQGFKTSAPARVGGRVRFPSASAK